MPSRSRSSAIPKIFPRNDSVCYFKELDVIITDSESAGAVRYWDIKAGQLAGLLWKIRTLTVPTVCWISRAGVWCGATS